MNYRFLIGVVFFAVACRAWAASPDSLLTLLFARFAAEEQPDVAAWSYDYRENFRQIPDAATLQRQREWFERYRQALTAIDRLALEREQRYEYDHLLYILDLHLQRVRLEQNYVAAGRPGVNDNGLSQLPDAAQWYALYVRWLTTETPSPDELYDFGLRQTEQAQREIQAIRQESGFAADSAGWYRHLQDPALFITDREEIIRQYREIQAIVYNNLHRLFADTSVPAPAIASIVDAGPDTPPAYYDPGGSESGTFYFNFYGGRHDSRAMAFLFLHEAVPGHHYQFVLARRSGTRPAFARRVMYPGYFEGWAAYVESLGTELDVYTSPYSRLGRWEWDLVRSVRVCLDVGIHYKGWSAEEALAFWRRYIPHQDETGRREIRRCTRWPAQVLSYKVGAAAFAALKQQMQQAQGATFDIRAFHALMLGRGQMPLPVIATMVQDAQDS